MTCLTSGISRPRAATEVATRTGARPVLKSLKASSLSLWKRSLYENEVRRSEVSIKIYNDMNFEKGPQIILNKCITHHSAIWYPGRLIIGFPGHQILLIPIQYDGIVE